MGMMVAAVNADWLRVWSTQRNREAEGLSGTIRKMSAVNADWLRVRSTAVDERNFPNTAHGEYFQDPSNPNEYNQRRLPYKIIVASDGCVVWLTECNPVRLYVSTSSQVVDLRCGKAVILEPSAGWSELYSGIQIKPMTSTGCETVAFSTMPRGR